jgi:hypothetical protein
VGLIAIDSLSVDPDQFAPGEDHDATLAQFFAHLASVRIESAETPVRSDPPRVDRLARARSSNRVRRTQLVADLSGLKTELRQVLRVTRRRLARASTTAA